MNKVELSRSTPEEATIKQQCFLLRGKYIHRELLRCGTTIQIRLYWCMYVVNIESPELFSATIYETLLGYE